PMKNRERGSETRGAAGWGMRGAVEGDHKKRTGRAPVLVDSRRRIEPRANRSSRLGESGSVRLHVVAVDVLLIAEVEASVRDHRMRPDRSARASTLAFRIEHESASLIPAFRARIDEDDAPVLLGEAVEHAVRAGDRSFAELVLLAPDDLARLEILAEPADAVRVPVEMLADANDAAMMVLHVLVEVDLLHGEVLR